MTRLIPLLLVAAMLGACERETGPRLAVEDVRVFAPLPGRSESVAYLHLRNPGDSAISLIGVSSPDFANAEIHQTTVDQNGVARMNMLGAVSIAAESELGFAPGGLHIMLLGPRRALLPGASVQIELTFDDGTVLLLDAPVQTRLGNSTQ